jgi:hypothetical protein
MVCVRQWQAWFLSLLAFHSLSISHALMVQPQVDKQGLSTSHQQQHQVKRAPSTKDYTTREHRLLREIALKIDEKLEDRDVVYFVGNSGA